MTGLTLSSLTVKWLFSGIYPSRPVTKIIYMAKEQFIPRCINMDISPRNKIRQHQGKCVPYMLFSNLLVICPVALLQNRWNLRLKHLCCNLRLDVVTGFLSQTVCLCYILYILCLLCMLRQLKLKMGLCFMHRQQLQQVEPERVYLPSQARLVSAGNCSLHVGQFTCKELQIAPYYSYFMQIPYVTCMDCYSCSFIGKWLGIGHESFVIF